MMKNTSPKGASSSDPFWDNALSLYLQAIMSYVWILDTKHLYNMETGRKLKTDSNIADQDSCV